MREEERGLEFEIRHVGDEVKSELEEMQRVQIDFIAIERLLDNPYQSRVRVDEGELEVLARTIGSYGFQGVLVARPDLKEAGMYQITAGHRRREAARLAGLRELPVVVQVLTNAEMAVLAATENLQRVDLSPLEEGRLFDAMVKQMGMTQMEVADAIKKDRGYVRNRLRLAHAPGDVQAFIEAKPDSLRAMYLLEIEKDTERALIMEQLLQKTLRTDDLPGYVAKLKRLKEEKAGRDGRHKRSRRAKRQREEEMVELEPELPSEFDPVKTTLKRRMGQLHLTLQMVSVYQKLVLETVMPITEVEREVLERVDMVLRGLAWR